MEIEYTYQDSLPDDSQCPVCKYFDVRDFRVFKILTDRAHGNASYANFLINAANCKCDPKYRSPENPDRKNGRRNVAH